MVATPAARSDPVATSEQARVAAHRRGPLLVEGIAGSGRSEALVLRLAALHREGVPAGLLPILTRSRANASELRARAERRLEGAHEGTVIATFEQAAEAILRRHSLAAGVDPFFTTLTIADRLAMLLDRLDDLPLRRHEIRGNPSGLLARLLRRIELLKHEAVTPGALRAWAHEGGRLAVDPAAREHLRREAEFADLFEIHDRIVRDSGGFDGADLISELTRLTRDRPDVADLIRTEAAGLMVDELEDAAPIHLDLIEQLVGSGAGGPELVCAWDGHQAVRLAADAGRARRWFERLAPGAKRLVLPAPARYGSKRMVAISAAVGREPATGDRSEEPDAIEFWRCGSERAEVQASARAVESLLAGGNVRPERICVISGAGWREARLQAAAFEERAIPYRYAGDAAFFQRPEVRDVLAWLRMLADPGDSAAVVRALTRPPTELRSVDLARVSTIARRRKLDMVSALEAALESPQLPPEARDRIQAFLKLHSAAAAALAQMRADVFVRRLIERVGFRRHRLFAATPEMAERLVNLSRLAELAEAWVRRSPGGTVRDFVRHITAVADAGEVNAGDVDQPQPGRVLLAESEQVKGLEFDHVILLGQHDRPDPGPLERDWVPVDLRRDPTPEIERPSLASNLAYLAMTRARAGLVMAWAERLESGSVHPAPAYSAALAIGGDEKLHDEEAFGPAEGIHSIYRMVRDEALETSWRAGSALSEMRLDTADDVNRAVARYLELIKLAALLQRPGEEEPDEALAALNELLMRVATSEQRSALEASALDDFVASEGRGLTARRILAGAGAEPSLDAFIPRSRDGLALSASDLELYRICPLRYKFARVFAIPQEPTINQRFGILVHNVLERFHSEELEAVAEGIPPGQTPGSLDRLLTIFEAGWRRTGFGASDDELQYRDRAVAALARYHERHQAGASRPVWLERRFSISIGDHQVRGRVDRVDRRGDGGYEVIDYKTGEQKATAELSDDVQLALYRLAAREAWRLEADSGSYWYVLSDERQSVPTAPDDAERVERTVLEVAAGIEAQDFEPRPDFKICSWCDYRLICPASEA